MKNLGVYIHIPFCGSKCPYCDFYSGLWTDDKKEEYKNAVIDSIKNQPFGDNLVNTIYFGGGTPSVMGSKALIQILNAVQEEFQLTNDCEISLEANPESTTLQLLKELKQGGFTRVSFGVQSSNAKELSVLGRKHSAEQAKEAIENAHKAGFTHISADLMLGVPYQTQETAIQSVNFLTALPLDHISAYMLSIEEDTPFARMDIQQHCMEEEQLSETYLAVVEHLEKAGFKQYEISNFAKEHGESLHNLKYWRTEEYIGIGPSAHSFYKGKRFAFPSDIEDYINAKGNWDTVNQDGKGGDYAEYGMLRLRLVEGINLDEYKKLYPEIKKEKIMKSAKILEKEGYINIEGNRIFFTPEGFLLSNYFIAQLLF